MNALKIVILGFYLLGVLSFHATEKDQPQRSDTRKVQEAVNLVRAALADSLGVEVPSLNVLIQTPSTKIFVSSASSKESAVTANTYFRFASNTKNFTAAAMLKMYQDGWLKVSDHVNDMIPGSKESYLPDSAGWNFPYRDSVTIELLMQHAAGVFDVDNDPVPGYNNQSFTEYTQQQNPAHQFTTAEMVNVLTEKKLYYFTPGSGHHYSNTGFSMLAEIIQRVYSSHSGAVKTYTDYITDSITGPSAKVPLPYLHFPSAASDSVLNSPYVRGTVISPGGVKQYGNQNMSAQVGEGNGFGTMDDLNTYIRTLMKGQNVLSPATVQLMQTKLSPGDSSYALGCTFIANLGYGHNGARIGYLSLMAYDPQSDVSVVSMIPLWDLRKGSASFMQCFKAISNAAYAARSALGYPPAKPTLR